MGRNTHDYKTAKSLSEEEQDIDSLNEEANESFNELDDTIDTFDNMGREYFDAEEYE